MTNQRPIYSYFKLKNNNEKNTFKYKYSLF